MAMSMSMASGSIRPGGKITIPSKYLPQKPTGKAAPKQPDYAKQAMDAANAARTSQEAGKQAALGYFDPAKAALAPVQAGLSAMSPELITAGQQAQMESTRRAQLGAYGQNLAGQYGDSSSGVESGIRRQIGMGIAGKQANLPIELGLDIAAQNRQAALGLYSAQAGVAGQMAGIAGQQAGVQTSYQYDPGLEYIKSLGQSAGYMGTTAPTMKPATSQPVIRSTPSLGGGGGMNPMSVDMSAGISPKYTAASNKINKKISYPSTIRR